MLTYYDQAAGRVRMKRRYKFAIWGFVIGALFGAALISMLSG